MEKKTKKKTRQAVRDGRSGVYGGKDLRKKCLLSLEWKRVGVMNNDSG